MIYLNFLKIGFTIGFGISVLMILFFAIKSKKFLSSLFINAFLGIGAVVVINITSKYSGVSIPINEFSVLASGVLGVPAVFGLLILNLIFI